mmetsp:Transcript_39146/g.103526  ORF Transcript_39146/g.103526 Transcript_39146/m.103526 type:complete len:837 (-) Transcript_39146:638-3148(-)
MTSGTLVSRQVCAVLLWTIVILSLAEISKSYALQGSAPFPMHSGGGARVMVALLGSGHTIQHGPPSTPHGLFLVVHNRRCLLLDMHRLRGGHDVGCDDQVGSDGSAHMETCSDAVYDEGERGRIRRQTGGGTCAAMAGLASSTSDAAAAAAASEAGEAASTARQSRGEHRNVDREGVENRIQDRLAELRDTEKSLRETIEEIGALRTKSSLSSSEQAMLGDLRRTKATLLGLKVALHNQITELEKQRTTLMAGGGGDAQALLAFKDAIHKEITELVKERTMTARGGHEQVPQGVARSREGLERFLKALRDHPEVDGVIDTGMSGESLQLLFLQDLGTVSSARFVCREEYKRVLKEMVRAFSVGLTSSSNAIVTGTAGIGKSAFRYYIIRQWLLGELDLGWKRACINLSENSFFYVNRDGSVDIAPSQPLDVDAVALLDPCSLVTSKPHGFKNIVVTTSASPLAGQMNKVSLSEFGKYAEVYVLGLWTVAEFEKLGVRVSDERLEMFSREVNGVRLCVPRWLLYAGNSEKLDSLIESSCDPLSRDALFDFLVSNREERPSRDSRLPYRLCVISESGKGRWSVDGFLSDFVASKVLEWAMSGADCRQQRIRSMLDNPHCRGALGLMFEKWAFHSLGSQGKQLILRPPGTEAYSFSALGTFKAAAVKTLSEWRALEMEPGVVYQAVRGNCPSIDGFGLVGDVLVLMQMTVGRTHRAAEWDDMKHLVAAANGRVGRAVRCVLVYVVDRGTPFRAPICTSLAGRAELVVGHVDDCFLLRLQERAGAGRVARDQSSGGNVEVADGASAGRGRRQRAEAGTGAGGRDLVAPARGNRRRAGRRT